MLSIGNVIVTYKMYLIHMYSVIVLTSYTIVSGISRVLQLIYMVNREFNVCFMISNEKLVFHARLSPNKLGINSASEKKKNADDIRFGWW